MELAGHRMVANHIIGGWSTSNRLIDQVWEWTCPASIPESCTFKPILTKLKFARGYHIALPITKEFAYQLCL